MKPLIVGENNPYGPDPEFALYPSPMGCAGWRLCHKVLGLDPDDYCERFDRMNLLSSARWDTRKARAAARSLLDDDRKNFILCGAKVAKAFGFGSKIELYLGTPWGVGDLEHMLDDERRYFVIPHPSGLCRAWADPSTVPQVRELLKEFLP